MVTALPRGEACPALAWAGGLQGGAGRSGQGPALPPERGPSRSRSRGGRRGGRGADTGVRAGGALEAAAPFPASRSSRPAGAKGRAPRPGVQTWPRPRVEESERAQQPRPSRPQQPRLAHTRGVGASHTVERRVPPAEERDPGCGAAPREGAALEAARCVIP